MGKNYWILWVCMMVVISCGPARKGLFGEKKSAHEQYGERLKDAALDETPMGQSWFAAAEKALAQPLTVTVPFRERGYFAPDQPTATGYLFTAKRGEKIQIAVTVIPDSSLMFTELWMPGLSPDNRERLQEADSTRRIEYEIENDGQYLLRLQPELLQGMEYTLTLTAGPSLAFPVADSGKPRLISFWQAPRDNGARRHEGVDISAAFRTPALAAADGIVHRVGDNRLGGKVVFMRPKGKNISLYYAHLDSQLVSSGQRVKAGDPLGWVGNTGNARNTAPHLHFGIYALGGAIDPLPFIDPREKKPEPLSVADNQIGTWARTGRPETLRGGPAGNSPAVTSLATGSALRILGATGKWYRAILPDGAEGFLNGSAITHSALRTYKPDRDVDLLAHPFLPAPSKEQIEPGTTLTAIGTYDNFYLVKHNNQIGWIAKD